MNTSNSKKGNAQREWLANVINLKQDDCIDWPFPTNRKGGGGYGLAYVGGRRVLAHRHVCAAVNGPPPNENSEAAHSCGRSICVNPAHLRWASAQENYADKLAHGTDCRGDKHPSVKLSDADAVEVRRKYKAGATTRALAAEYGVSQTTISFMVSGRRRRWLAVPLVASLLLACTPEQLSTYQAVTGDILSTQRESELLELDDRPWRLSDGSVIELNGDLTKPAPCDVERQRINALQYNYLDPNPAMEAFRSVSRCRGWSQAQTDSWAIAVEDIMRFESGFCYNVLGGARVGNSQGCVLSRQGRKGDAGFGQLIGLHYRGWLCGQERLCSKWEIIATPWASMTALLALVERSGTQGWCFADWARRLHRRTCNNPGMNV